MGNCPSGEVAVDAPAEGAIEAIAWVSWLIEAPLAGSLVWPLSTVLAAALGGGSAATPVTCHSVPTDPIALADVIAFLLMS